MGEKKQTFHGSDLEKIEHIYGIRKEDIVPFGGNVNPLGISPLLKESMTNHIEAICDYPDRDYQSLRDTLTLYTNVPKDHILVGNGATELISLTLQVLQPKHAILLSPTYSEYMREISIIGGSYEEFYLKEEDEFHLNLPKLKESLTDDVDLFAFCNPNNPTSSALSTKEIGEILEHCKAHNIFVLIDETYVEFAPSMEDITATSFIANHSNLMILRGTSKFFAAPGLRLGYGLCGSLEFLQRLSAIKNPWTINTLAALAGEAMFMDTDYINKTKDYIFAQRTICLETLKAQPKLKVYPSYANFILVRLPQGITSHEMFTRCIREGLMIRDCSDFEGLDGQYIRFCLRLDEENQRLLKILCDV